MNRRKPPQDPLDFDIEPSLFLTEAAELIAHANQVWDQVAAVPLAEATFANAILPILHEEDARSQRAAWLDWLRSTTPLTAIRDASCAFHQAMTDANNQRFAREDVFRVVDAVWRHQEEQQPPLNAEQQLCLERVAPRLSRDGTRHRRPATTRASG
ncbi:hypothetical protein NLG97_g8347 [Lecanicillium saksenae]|uniref:Uncharacterized protein n=1 Tax=Lecanicillium saksenae TaxID=468837 RepID=A0ACC1QLK3_9HYPO|nr:hypothetical protein NLG97_g8347 [Lecanicillium saksenae]